MDRTMCSPELHSRIDNALLRRCALILVLLIALVPTSILSAQTPIKPFLGRWDITIKTPTRELPSWIDVSEAQGQAKIVMVGTSDHATPLATAQVKDGEIEFVSPKGEEGFGEDTTFKGKLVGGQLTGTATGTSGTSWPWIGKRAPSMKRTGTPVWGKPITLFNGKDFTGWRFSDPSHASNWKVENGELVNHGHGSEIITTAKFEDFKLHLSSIAGPNPIVACISGAAMRCK